MWVSSPPPVFQVHLKAIGKYHNTFIQEVGTHPSAVTIFIEELGENHLYLTLSLTQRFPNFFCSATPKKTQQKMQQSFVLSQRLMFDNAQITRTRMTITTSTKFQYNATKLHTSFHFKEDE